MEVALKLVVVRGTQKLGEIPLTTLPTFEVGTAPEANVKLVDPEVAPHHLKFFPQPPGYSCLDLSGRGFLLNNQHNSLASVGPGDMIKIGSHLLQFVGTAPGPPQPPPAPRPPMSAASRARVTAPMKQQPVEALPTVQQPDFRQTLVDEETEPATGHPPLPPPQPAAPGPATTQAGFLVVRGHDSGQWFPLGQGRITVGRQTGDILITDLKVSRTHFAVESNGPAAQITDLNSSNGTYVNEQRLTGSQPLKDGDHVRVGNSVLQYVGSG